MHGWFITNSGYSSIQMWFFLKKISSLQLQIMLKLQIVPHIFLSLNHNESNMFPSRNRISAGLLLNSKFLDCLSKMKSTKFPQSPYIFISISCNFQNYTISCQFSSASPKITGGAHPTSTCITSNLQINILARTNVKI